jgi:hypothetical protein
MANLKIFCLEYAGKIFKKVGHKYFVTAFDSVRANPSAHANGIAPTVHTSMYIRMRTGTGIGIGIRKCICICIYIYGYVYVYICICICICI